MEKCCSPVDLWYASCGTILLEYKGNIHTRIIGGTYLYHGSSPDENGIIKGPFCCHRPISSEVYRLYSCIVFF
jgi:hypothetical protein